LACSAAVNWISAGGSRLSTPQWTGLIAVANAGRALGGKAALGAPHAVLYGQIASVPGTYAGACADIVKGSDGSCAACTAKTGYDQLTGLGTPNVGSLLSTLSGLSVVTATAPHPCRAHQGVDAAGRAAPVPGALGSARRGGRRRRCR
jgi:hypothetical protein